MIDGGWLKNGCGLVRIILISLQYYNMIRRKHIRIWLVFDRESTGPPRESTGPCGDGTGPKVNVSNQGDTGQRFL